MSHPDQVRFFSEVVRALPDAFASGSILEVGSLDVNGSLRSLVKPGPGLRYIGIDIAPGRGVDIVVPGQAFAAPSESFDVVWSAECMEHNADWRATTANMVRLLKPGGLFVLSCAGPGRPVHGTPNSDPESSPPTVEMGSDYYGNLELRDFVKSGAIEGLSPVASWFNWSHRDLYIIGTKGGTAELDLAPAFRAIEHFVAEANARSRHTRLEEVVLRSAGRRVYEATRRLLVIHRIVQSKWATRRLAVD